MKIEKEQRAFGGGVGTIKFVVWAAGGAGSITVVDGGDGAGGAEVNNRSRWW